MHLPELAWLGGRFEGKRSRHRLRGFGVMAEHDTQVIAQSCANVLDGFETVLALVLIDCGIHNPVSYTHLDVYKRQSMSSTLCSGRRLCLPVSLDSQRWTRSSYKAMARTVLPLSLIHI